MDRVATEGGQPVAQDAEVDLGRPRAGSHVADLLAGAAPTDDPHVAGEVVAVLGRGLHFDRRRTEIPSFVGLLDVGPSLLVRDRLGDETHVTPRLLDAGCHQQDGGEEQRNRHDTQDVLLHTDFEPRTFLQSHYLLEQRAPEIKQNIP